MKHYVVWMEGSDPRIGTIIYANNSFQARTICARAWGVDILCVMARALTEPGDYGLAVMKDPTQLAREQCGEELTDAELAI